MMELFRYLAGEKKDTADLLAKHIAKMNDFFEAKKIKMVIWHDMFLSREMSNVLGPSMGPANGGAPYLTAAALGQIPKSVIINYWMYQKDWAAFPSIEYFKNMGFSVWSSPWFYPNRLVRFSAAHQIPTMGTIWMGVPKCFTFSPSDAAVGLYASAAWNPGGVDTNAESESLAGPSAASATRRMLFDRSSIGVDPGSMTIVRGSGSRRTFASPEVRAETIETHFGVPLDFSTPAKYPPLATGGKALPVDAKPAAILINGNDQVVLDGCNTAREAYKLVLYMRPMESTKANIWGVEVVVSRTGEVLSVYGRDTGRNADSQIPEGGFVLSAHGGAGGKMYDKLMSLRKGDRISVLGEESVWLGGATPIRLACQFPGRRRLTFDSVDGRRGISNLVIFQSGFGNFTGTKDDGVEVAISNGIVAQVFVGKGNVAIPLGGYVLSVQNENLRAKALFKDLAVGTPIEILALVGNDEKPFSGKGPADIWEAKLGASVKRIWFSATTPYRLSAGTLVGTLFIHRKDASVERLVTRASYEIVTGSGIDTPASITNGPSWLVQRESNPRQCLVYEWRNSKPAVDVEKVAFQPAMGVLQSGLEIYGMTTENAGR